jgi:hypothetical protein
MQKIELWTFSFFMVMTRVPSAGAIERLPVIADVPIEAGPSEGIRGITLAPIEEMRLGPVGYGSEPCREALLEIAALGATWISLTPFGRMDDLDSVEILHDFEIPFSRNVELMRRTAADAHALGLKIALIPHVYVMSGKWRGEIDLGGDARFGDWFAQYSDFVLAYAALAEELGAELFSIGVEFKSSSNFYDEQWRAIIERVRLVYSGLLTYSANWDEVEQVTFWDDLDLIGINAFWPLASRPGADWREMSDKAMQIGEELEDFALGWSRPIVFTEFGVKSARDAALAPWEWPEHCENLVYDETYQADAYLAMLGALTSKPWFKGMFIWKYFSDPYDNTQEERTGFSPRSKIAEEVLSSWYSCDWELQAFGLLACLPPFNAQAPNRIDR